MPENENGRMVWIVLHRDNHTRTVNIVGAYTNREASNTRALQLAGPAFHVWVEEHYLDDHAAPN